MRAVHLECKTSRSPLVFTCACCWDANPVSPSVGAIIPTERVPFDVCVCMLVSGFCFCVRQFNRNIIWARQKTLLVDGTSYLRSIWSVQKGVLFVTILCVQLCVGCFFFPASSRCYSRISLPSFNYNPFERQTAPLGSYLHFNQKPWLYARDMLGYIMISFHLVRWLGREDVMRLIQMYKD